MKRFRSPLLSIQRVHEQLLRVAEIQLLEAQRVLRHAESELQRKQGVVEQREDALLQLMREIGVRPPDIPADVSDLRRGPGMSRIRMMHHQIAFAREAAQSQLSTVARAQALHQTRVQEYRTLKASIEGIATLLDRQRQEHRRQQLRHEQITLDEAAQNSRAQQDQSQRRHTASGANIR